MAIDDMKASISAYRDSLKGKAGSVCTFSTSGPVGMSVIDALVKTIEAQDKRIATLERRLKA